MKNFNFKLKKVTSTDRILRSSYVLSLLVPSDIRDACENATFFATMLRNVASNYKYSLLPLKKINPYSITNKYSYVSCN